MKKIYSVLTNAYSLYKVENGEPIGLSADENGAIKVANIFKPYLKIAKDCGTGVGDGCIHTGEYLFKNGISSGDYSSYNEYYKLRLVDGSSLWFRASNSAETNSYFTIFFDVNGEVGPNKWGHDLFDFRLYKNRGLLPVGIIAGDFSFENCAPANQNGYGCAAWVIQKGNLDYLKCPNELTWTDNKCPN